MFEVNCADPGEGRATTGRVADLIRTFDRGGVLPINTGPPPPPPPPAEIRNQPVMLDAAPGRLPDMRQLKESLRHIHREGSRQPSPEQQQLQQQQLARHHLSMIVEDDNDDEAPKPAVIRTASTKRSTALSLYPPDGPEAGEAGALGSPSLVHTPNGVFQRLPGPPKPGGAPPAKPDFIDVDLDPFAASSDADRDSEKLCYPELRRPDSGRVASRLVSTIADMTEEEELEELANRGTVFETVNDEDENVYYNSGDQGLEIYQEVQ